MLGGLYVCTCKKQVLYQIIFLGRNLYPTTLHIPMVLITLMLIVVVAILLLNTLLIKWSFSACNHD
jgi:hypothetical protein